MGIRATARRRRRCKNRNAPLPPRNLKDSFSLYTTDPLLCGSAFGAQERLKGNASKRFEKLLGFEVSGSHSYDYVSLVIETYTTQTHRVRAT